MSIRIILRNKYTHFEEALDILNLESSEERRKHLSLKFAIKSTKNPIISNLSHKKRKKVHEMILRKAKIFHVNIANTEIYKKFSNSIYAKIVK